MAKLKFWAPIISFVGNVQCLSENCNFLSRLLLNPWRRCRFVTLYWHSTTLFSVQFSPWIVALLCRICTTITTQPILYSIDRLKACTDRVNEINWTDMNWTRPLYSPCNATELNWDFSSVHFCRDAIACGNSSRNLTCSRVRKKGINKIFTHLPRN